MSASRELLQAVHAALATLRSRLQDPELGPAERADLTRAIAGIEFELAIGHAQLVESASAWLSRQARIEQAREIVAALQNPHLELGELVRLSHQALSLAGDETFDIDPEPE